MDPAKQRDLLWRFMGRNLEMLRVFPAGHTVTYAVYQPGEMHASGSSNAYAATSGSGWTCMFDLSKMPMR